MSSNKIINRNEENTKNIAEQRETSNELFKEKYEALEKQLEEERSILANLRHKISTGEDATIPEMCCSSSITTENEDLEKKLDEASSKIVSISEKNVKLAIQVEKKSSEVSNMKREIDNFRIALLQGINGGVIDVDNYLHVSLEELLRIRLQEMEGKGENIFIRPDISSDKSKILDGNNKTCVFDGSNPLNPIRKVEKELLHARKINSTLKSKCMKLEEKVKTTDEMSKSLNTLQQKIAKLLDRSRLDKETRTKIENELLGSNKRTEVLSDHIDKLMMHLKHEVTVKIRAITDKSKAQKQVEMAKNRIQTIEKKNIRKDQLIDELKQEGKILEEQLRLMDEKYIELRMKLDWTRTQTEKNIKKKEEEIQQLRDKITLLGTFHPGGRGKSSIINSQLLRGEKGPSKKSKNAFYK